MHELSIALSMIEQIAEESERRNGAAVEAVYLRIGVLAGIDPQALSFAYELACQGTELEGSHLQIECVALLVRCSQCGATHAPDPQHVLCPECVTPPQEILRGQELEVFALELAA
jgi:hydrogenase nickel incorporation protein HypA/HybF